MNTKVCVTCHVEKEVSEFYKKTIIKGGKKYPTSSCKECERLRASKNYAANKERRKKEAVEYKGGRCIRCGYKKCLSALEFHHRDPSQKDGSVGQFSRNKLTEKAMLELDKCDLLCANCHRETHERDKTNGRKPSTNNGSSFGKD